MEEAKKVALGIIENNTNARSLKASADKIKSVNQLTDSGHSLMYEVVFEDNSAVLLSGSKACLPVLGHYTVSEESQSVFDDETPGGLKDLLEVYRRQIEACFQNDTISLYYQNEWQELQAVEMQKNANTMTSKTTSAVVTPLLTTAWGQSSSNDSLDNNAYNYLVTETSDKCDNSKKCPTGCTSVAMAQIMRYWNYPVYYHQAIGFPTWFDWCNMPNGLYTSNPNYEKQRNAIATLIKAAGTAAKTDYCYLGACQSMATIWNARKALEQDFGYCHQAHVDWRWAHTEDEWIQKIKNDLNNGRPVMYCALDITETAGHTFIIDGYNSDDKFHINWGYRGNYQNSYFSINKLTPYNGFEYTSAEHALFELYPEYEQSICDFELSLYSHYQQSINTITYMLYSGLSLPSTILDDIKKSYPSTMTRLISGGNIVQFANNELPQLYVIYSGTTYEYVAHEAIILKPGFHAEAGSNFTARIEPCAECENNMMQQASREAPKNIQKTIEYHTIKPSKTDLLLYPNPTGGLLTVQSPKPLARVEVYGLGGERLLESRDTTLDLHALPDGMYIVMLHFADGTRHSEKVVKQL